MCGTLALAAAGCAWVAVQGAPPKVATPLSAKGSRLIDDFWEALHAGQYSRIDALLELHDQVIVAEPGDTATLAHAGWLHAWRASERVREAPAARMIEHVSAARRLFEEASALRPDEARYLGFAAAFTMAEADVLGDQRLLREGYYRMRDAVAAYPEFNLFTSGYVMSRNPVGSAAFQEGLQQQWQDLDACFGTTVDRQHPAIARYLPRETGNGPKRVCWNSWIAPHNWEGFFLNFGDMLARTGDLYIARQMYEAARLSSTYAAWPWRPVLERRLARIDQLPELLNHPAPDEPEWTPMIRSAFACTGCHQSQGLASLPQRVPGGA